jgi:hypothetical protein
MVGEPNREGASICGVSKGPRGHPTPSDSFSTAAISDSAGERLEHFDLRLGQFIDQHHRRAGH